MEIIEEPKIKYNKRFIINKQQLLSNNNTNYYIHKQLGFGSYSNIYDIIYSVNGSKTNFMRSSSPRCVKIFKSSDKYTSCGKREISIMKKINKPNLFVSFFDSFIHESHFCIISNKFDFNLYEYSKSNILCKKDVKFISKQILKGLIYLRQNKIIHSDLKPENILINKKENVTSCVICDFNLSIDTTRVKCLRFATDITTLWYRAPEIYLDMNFSYEIDIWAFGCILYELIVGKPLFNPKTTTNNVHDNKLLYEQHISFIGMCPHEPLENIDPIDFENKIKFDPKIFKTGYQTIFSECIKWNPTKRFLPEDCLRYIRGML